MGELLAHAGYQVYQAHDSGTALAMVDKQQPERVLLEVSLERGAGWDLLARLVSFVPVIIVSGQGLEEDVVRGLDAGAIDYIAKPFRSEELLARVRARLNRAHTTRLAPAPAS